MKYEIIGKSKQIKNIITLIQDAATSNVPVLITGEKGTGRELIARNLHDKIKNRKKRFVTINCGSITSKRIESSLRRSHVSIFLSELGEIEPPLQVTLLRVLKEKEFKLSDKYYRKDFKLISSTSHDLEEQVVSGNFRQDLLYMLNVIPIDMPPLRSRKEDIPLLAEHFLRQFCVREKKMLKISSNVMDIFLKYQWPGNVRELKNVIERAVIVATKPTITLKELPLYIMSPKPLPFTKTLANITSQGTLDEVSRNAQKIAETQRIDEALGETLGNKSKAAKILQVSYKTLLKKIKEYGIRDT